MQAKWLQAFMTSFILNAPDHPSFGIPRTTFHQLAICITNKALLTFAELHELFVIKLLVDSYVVHSKKPLNFLLLFAAPYLCSFYIIVLSDRFV